MVQRDRRDLSLTGTAGPEPWARQGPGSEGSLPGHGTLRGPSGGASIQRCDQSTTVALKFYTQDGDFDIVGNNTPVFFVRDPMKFPDFIHSQKRLPDSGLRDNTMQWDFWTLSPEGAHQVAYLMGDRGLPKSWSPALSLRRPGGQEGTAESATGGPRPFPRRLDSSRSRARARRAGVVRSVRQKSPSRLEASRPRTGR